MKWDLKYDVKGSSKRMSCYWAGEGSRFVFDYFDEDIALSTLSPNYGPVAGGIEISCNGYFGNFSLSGYSGDAILLGSYTLERTYIISVTTTRIIFKLPPMHVVQSPTFEIHCVVIVHGIRSNEVSFAYESLTDASISLTGSSFEEKTSTYMIPVCNSTGSTPDDMAISFFAALNKGAPMTTLSFQWRVVTLEGRAEVHSLSGSSEAQSFVFGISKLSINQKYEVLVKISDTKYATEITVSVLVQATAARVLGVGLSLEQTRTLALPPVDSRFTASVTEQGDCSSRSKRLSYDWTFLSITKTLTSTSQSVEVKVPSPRRLGREFMIPKHALSYGKHKVTVKVYYTDDPDTYGIASSWLNIQPAILEARIGSGESFIRVTDASDLEMTGEFSYDPDDNSASLTYQWQCERSIEGSEKFSAVTKCPDALLPSSQKEKFFVKSSVLQSIRFISKKTYVRYSLLVRKSYKHIGVRSSSVVSQVVEIAASEDTVAARGSISIANQEGYPVLLNNVPFYETLVIAPYAAVGSAWRFKVVEPASDAFTFLKNPNNLLSRPGFYTTTSFIAGRNALGIRENVLRPNSIYKFEVQYESKNADNPSTVELTLRTMAQPVVTFLRPSQLSGTADTVFTAIAISTVESYGFKFYFYVRLEDGVEMCIDGCSGMRKISFQLSMPGTHTIRCEMVDARGRFVVDSALQKYNVTIVNSNDSEEDEKEVMRQSELLKETFDLGDHSGFELESLRLAWYGRTVGSGDGLGSDMVGELVGMTAFKLAKMFGKTQPNTALARDYMHITSAFAGLAGENGALGNAEMFYSVCRMLLYAVRNTPVTERFDMKELVIAALRDLARHARQLHAEGTSRQRLVGSVRTGDGNFVNQELLEVFEMAVPVLVRVISRGKGCGSTMNVVVADMLELQVGVFCSKEHAVGLEGRYARLSMCGDVFSETGDRRVVFALAEMKDYIQESGVLGMRENQPRDDVVVEKGAVALDTGNMANHGFVVVKTVAADADSGDERSLDMRERNGREGCFSVVQDVRETRSVFPTYEEVQCGTERTVMYVRTKGFGEKVESGMYGEQGIASVTLGSRDNKEEVVNGVLKIGSRLGHVDGETFGVKRGRCLDLKPHVIGIVGGIGMGVIAGVGVMVVVIGLGLAGVRRQRSLDETAVFVEGGDAPFIDRDVYGRNHEGLANIDIERELDDDGEGDGDGEDDEQVVFESPRMLGAHGGAGDVRQVSKLFGDQ